MRSDNLCPWFFRVFGFWFAFPVICPGQAPDLHFHHLTMASGLSQSINAFVYRDKEGFVWISSMDGLNRFDGTSIKIYRPRSGDNAAMKGENIQSPFYEDDDGDLWFGTNEALNCYRRSTDDFAHYQCLGDSGQLQSDPYYIFHREGSQLWLRMGDNFFVADWRSLKQGKHPQQAFRKIGTTSNVPVRCFVRPDKSNRGGFDIFVTSFGFSPGLLHYYFNGDSMRLAGHRVFSDEKANTMSWVLPDGGDSLWIATGRGLMLYRSGSRSADFPGNKGLLRVAESVRCVIPWGRRCLFVSAQSGLYLFDKLKGEYLRRYHHDKEEDSSLADDFVWELYLDQTETLWASLWFKGLDFVNLRKSKFEKIKIQVPKTGKTGASFFVPKTMCESIDGQLWLGSNVNGLLRTDGNFRPLSTLAVKEPDIEKIIRTYDGKMWTLTSRGKVRCFRKVNESWQEMPVRNASNAAFSQIGLLRSGETWLVDGDAEKFYRAQQTGRGWDIVPVQSPELQNTRAGAFYEDSDRNLWVAGQKNAIEKFRNSGKGYEPAGKIPVSGEVLSFAETPGAVWATGNFGLLRIPKNNPDSSRIYTEREGLPNQTVYAAVPDANGRLWLSTNKGIARFTPQSDSFRVFGLADGLQDYEFNRNAFLRLSDGRILFGGIKGFNVFHPDSIRDLSVLPGIRITGLFINDHADTVRRNIALSDSLEFSWRDNTLSFEFVAMEYSDPANNKLQYRLFRINGEPYDDDWVLCRTAKGFARYANLPPGQYAFHIMGANSDGVWNPEPRRLFFKIHPPFWQTWWFRTICLIFLAGMIYAAVRAYVGNKLRIKNLQLREQRLHIEKQEALTQERNRIAGEMHDDLGGGLTSIRMLSSRVQKKITSPETKTQVDKIAQYSQELVQKMGEIIWAMNSNFDTAGNLIAYIRRYAVDFLDVSGLRHHINEPEEIPDFAISGERRRNVYLAVKESLHNIVKHAGAERVTISFSLAGDQLTVSVQDDGKGIDLDQINQFGNGLYNMRKRLRDVGGDMRVENFEGTLLTFIVPLENSLTA